MGGRGRGALQVVGALAVAGVIAFALRTAFHLGETTNGTARWARALPASPSFGAPDLLDGASGGGPDLVVAGHRWPLPRPAARVHWVSAPGGRGSADVGRDGVVVAADGDLLRLRPDGTARRLDAALTTAGTPGLGSTGSLYAYDRWTGTAGDVRWAGSVVREAGTDRLLLTVRDGVVLGVVDGGVVVQRGGALPFQALKPPTPVTVSVWTRSAAAGADAPGTERVVATTDDLTLDGAERLQAYVSAAGGSTAVVSRGPDGPCLRLLDLRRTGRDAVRPCPAANVTLSADGRWLAATCDRTGALVDPVTGARRTLFPARDGGPGGDVCTSFTPDGSRVRQTFSVGNPPLAWVCELATGSCLREIVGTG